MAKLTKIELVFEEEKKTKRTVRFREILEDEAWSDQDVAVGPLYVKKQALEMIGSPVKIKVTIEPA